LDSKPIFGVVSGERQDWVLGIFMPMPVRTCVFRTEECGGEDPRPAGGLPLCRGTPYALLMFLRNKSDHTVGPMNSPTHFPTSPASMEISAIRGKLRGKAAAYQCQLKVRIGPVMLTF
jgi:hypothetical protein